MWGHPYDMDKILDICKKHNLFLIEIVHMLMVQLIKEKKLGHLVMQVALVFKQIKL